MVTDIIKKIERWSDAKKLPQKQKSIYRDIAQKYQRGDPLPEKEEDMIAHIIENFNQEEKQ